MFRHYIQIALRTLGKNKGFSLVTLSGLVVGMVAFALIMQYVLFETSYDTFQPKSQTTYRVAFKVGQEDNQAVSYATTFLPIASIMKDEFPEVTDFNRILYLDRHAVVTHEGKVFQQENVIYADPSFFTFFGYPLIQGDTETVLRETNTVAISESLSEKYFGSKNPIGQFIKLNEEFNELVLLVTGVYKDIPANTHIKPKMVVSLRSIETLPETVTNTWSWPIYMNYIQLREGSDAALLEIKLQKFASQHIQHKNQKRDYSIFLQPLSSIHLHSHLEYEIEENGNSTIVYLLLFSAILILIIAYVNYINLATAKSLSRAKEVGVRKVLGSRNSQLVSQFVMEAGSFNMLALVLAAIIVITMQQYFRDLAGIEFDFDAIDPFQFWVVVAGCLLTGTVLSAFYPSWILASCKPVLALKGNVGSGNRFFARRALVIFQFTATIGLMINAYAVYEQVSLMRDTSAGIDINPILIVNAPRIAESGMTTSDREDPFRTNLLRITGIQNASISSSIPGVWISKASGIYRRGREQDKELIYHTLGVDYNFLETYSMKLLAGRNFSELYPTDDNAIILTENAVKQLGFSGAEQALGERIVVEGNEKEVIGITENYHHMSLREAYSPIIVYPEWHHKEYYSIRLQDGAGPRIAEVLMQLEKQWKSIYPSNPFEHKFLKDAFLDQYNSDVKFGKAFNFFAVLAMIVTCLGLLGLVSFITFKRTKEIGIRKVLGSTTIQIAVLLFRDISSLLLTAGLLAMPLAYYTITLWLSQFAFRIELSTWIFTGPLIAVGMVAVFSISYQVIKAARTNPVNTLKSE